MKILEQTAYGVGMALFWTVMSKIAGFENVVFIALAIIYINVINIE